MRIQFMLCALALASSINLSSHTTVAQPIALHPDNPHVFVYGGESTLLITSAEHYGAIVNREFDYHRYLDTLAQDGLNYTRIFVGSYIENSGSFGIERNTLAPGPATLLPWKRSTQPGFQEGGHKFNLSQWDPDYFARLDQFLQAAAERNIIVEVTLFSSIYTDANWATNPLNPDNTVTDVDSVSRTKVHTLDNGNLLAIQERLVRKVVRELNKHDNVFFEIQNEPWSDQQGRTHPLNPYDPDTDDKWVRKAVEATTASLDWQKRVVDWIVNEESRLPKKHLIAQNYCNFMAPIEQIDPRISIMNFHYAWPQVVRWNYGFQRPVSFDESGFAGKGEDIYRRQAWQFILAGGAVFNNLDYSFAVGQEDGTFVENRSGGYGSPMLRRQLGFLKRFLNDFDCAQLHPDLTTVVHSPGTRTWTLALVGQAYAIYVLGAGSGQLTCQLPAGKYSVEWWDPRDAKSLASQSLESNGDDTPVVLQCPQFRDEAAVKVVRTQ